MDLAESSDMLVENAMNASDQDQLTYDAYLSLLKDVKIDNVDSSYVYLVNEDGTMLYHPTEEKVGQPVENVVVTGLVKQLQNGEISRAVQDVAEGSTNMATSILDINDNLGTMSSETQVIDSSVYEIKKQAAIVQESSQLMSEKMRNMQQSSARMDAGIATISDRIQKVNEVVDRVSQIVSVIEDISGQTNLLSLNASIEAARAGDAGRGFAVVAEEIRVLSDNTSEQLENIRNIISELISECSECVKASENIVADNATQKEEIGYVLSEFGTLDEQIGLTADKAEEIKQLVETMVELNGNITQSSGGLTDVSSANAAATEEMTANIEELNAMMHGVADMAGQMHAQSEELNQALQYFK